MESIEERQEAWSDSEEESDEDVALENIVDETMEEHVEELMEILGQRWSCYDYPTTVIQSTHRLASGALSSVEEAVDLVLAHLEAPGDLAHQLAPVIAHYFRMLMREWLGFAHSEDGGDGDGDGDEILSQFRTRHYNNNDDVGDDGEEEMDDCCVCLERLHCGLVATLHCRHEFHGDCIRRWLRCGRNFCPLCKATALR